VTRHSRGIFLQVKGDSPDQVHSDQMVLWTVKREAGPYETQSKEFKTRLAQVGPSESSQLKSNGSLMARWEAGPCERWSKTPKRELENNSRKPRDLAENLHSNSLQNVQLTLSQGKKEKENEVADDEDDVVRTNVSQDPVVAVTLCTEELFLSTQ
jgi:hypothetical protein